MLAFGTYQVVRALSVPDLDASFVFVQLPVAQLDQAKEPANGLLLFTAENNTSRMIDNVEVVAEGVRRVDHVKISSSSGRLESTIYANPQLFQLRRDGSLALIGISQIIPRASVTVAVEGVFMPIMFTRRVRVTSDADSARVSEHKVVGGLTRLLDDYSVLIGFILASLALVYGLRRLRR